MPTSPPSYTTPPASPQRTSPSTFATRADAWVGWLESYAAEVAALAANVYANAGDAYTEALDAAAEASAAAATKLLADASAAAAAASAAAAANSAGAALWVSGNNYAVGDVRRSPANNYAYRCTATATGRTTDPSTDTGYWALAAASLPVMVLVTGTTETASPNGHYVLTNAAATTITLPAAPAAGDPVWVTVGNDRVDNVIARNGKPIMGLAENMTLDAATATAALRFVDDTIGWRLT